MSYTALYRKFRPTGFGDVKGQDHIVTTLKNQIKANRIGHAYLFTGTRGTGKTTIAKIFARMVNCENPSEDGPCGECRICKAIASGASMNVIEIDAASNNGVDNIREIVDEVSYSPAEGKYKVYIIDEVHMLSTGAFNALLKTLEEPPSYVIFILATTEVHKLPITILSRCQRYDFKRITIDTIASRMKELVDIEQVDVEEKALKYIAKAADGSMRDALSILDQCISFNLGQNLTYDKVLDVLGAVDTEVFDRLLESILNRDVNGCIKLLDEITMQGRELVQFVTDFIWYLRNVLLAKAADDLEDIIDMSSENLEKLKAKADKIEADLVIRYIRIFSELSNQIKFASQKRILIEVALIKLCKPQMETNIDSVLDRVRLVEEKLENGEFTPVAFSAPAQKTSMEETVLKRPKLPEAIPEDIREVVKNWPAIAGNADNPMKAYLKNMRLSLGENNRLIAAIDDEVGADYTQKPENIEKLESLIADFIGKEVKVDIRGIKNDKEFSENYVDLGQIIKMEIEEED